MKTSLSKITLNLSSNAEVSVKGFIAPIEYTQRNYHVDWDELANLKAAEPEKQYPASVEKNQKESLEEKRSESNEDASEAPFPFF